MLQLSLLECCGLTQRVAKHSTVFHSLLPSQWDGAENGKKVEIVG